MDFEFIGDKYRVKLKVVRRDAAQWETAVHKPTLSFQTTSSEFYEAALFSGS